MVFVLSDELCNFTNKERNEVLHGVTNILIGYFEGNNLVEFNDRFYKKFEPLIIDDRAKMAMYYIHSNDTFSYDVKFKFNVVRKETAKNNEVGIKLFSKTSHIQPSIVLCENANDVSFYSIVTIILLGIDKDYLSYQVSSGGGIETANKLEYYQNERLFALTIVDSDKKYSNASYGATCNAVRNKYDSSAKTVLLHILPVHEVENFLPPLYILSKLPSKCENEKKIIKSLNKNGIECLRYYDIKEGISIENIKANKDYYDFARKVYKIAYDADEKDFIKHVKTCECQKKNVLPSIGNMLVSKYIREDTSKIAQYPFAFERELREISELFFSFTCCRGKSSLML